MNLLMSMLLSAEIILNFIIANILNLQKRQLSLKEKNFKYMTKITKNNWKILLIKSLLIIKRGKYLLTLYILN